MRYVDGECRMSFAPVAAPSQRPQGLAGHALGQAKFRRHDRNIDLAFRHVEQGRFARCGPLGGNAGRQIGLDVGAAVEPVFAFGERRIGAGEPFLQLAELRLLGSKLCLPLAFGGHRAESFGFRSSHHALPFCFERSSVF